MKSEGGTTAQVLVVDDEEHILKAWKWMLAAHDFQVLSCGNASEALEILARHPIDVLITDVMMPGISGLELLSRIKERSPDIEVIVMTGAGSIQDAVKAMQVGAFDYLTKPFTEIEECINKVRQAARLKRLRDENTRLRQQVAAAPGSALLESRSPRMKAALGRMAQVARVDANVLICGPSGVGKSVFARAIHDRSPRRDKVFVSVDCSSIPADLIESELFGHVKGAFTGAIADKPGLFEQAHHGTIFLDEIGDMPLAMQSRLLRVLQEQVVRRVGGGQDVKVDVRVISATNIDLPAGIAAGRFREDLYFRLKVVELALPGLSERAEDIPRLAHHFVQRHAGRLGKPIKGITEACMAALQAHHWKGNVRELEHAIEAAMVFETGEELTVRHLPREIGGGEPAGKGTSAPVTPAAAGAHEAVVDLDLPFREALEKADWAFRVAYLTGLMERHRSVSAAARHAEMDRANFRRMLRRFEVTDYPRGGD